MTTLFPIFKVNKLRDKNNIETVYVFFGSGPNLEKDIDLNDLFMDEPTNKLFTGIFDESETEYIQKEKVDVIFIKDTIHIDDNIGTIKLKLFTAINQEYSINEMYLFCLKEDILNPVTIYQSLTQNDKLPLSKVRLDQVLMNIYDLNEEPMPFELEDKDKYTFDDILHLDLTNKEYLLGKPLGQKIVFTQEYPFIANPFMVNDYDLLLERSRSEITTLNNSLLLETGTIYKNNIYLCLANDVFDVADINDISLEYTSKIYYPFLFKDGIESLETLDEKRGELIDTTNKMLTSDTERVFKTIDMFYDMFETQEPSVKFNEKLNKTGIKNIKISIYPEYKIKIPVEVIFKLVHATQEFPLIKYNPEYKQENLYRLYCDKKTADGRKIPYLNKATIFRLIKSIGRGKSVSIYTIVVFKGFKYEMSIEFEETGVINVSSLSDFENLILISDGKMFENIDTIISLAVNPILEQIKPFFEQSGLEIPLFKSITHSSVEIRDIKYSTIYNITSLIDVNKYLGCTSSIFAIENANIKKGLKMRFKRVSNFNKRDSQEAFIIEKIDQGSKFDEIVEQLLSNYDDLTKEEAQEIIMNIRSELEVTRGANKRRAVTIKINPGFLTTMEINSITSELLINVTGINNIYYLNTLPIYLNSFVRITQDINSSKLSSKYIQSLCSGKEIVDLEFDQITASSEQSVNSNEIPSIKDESPLYSDNKDYNELEQGENMDELLDMLGYEDDENDETNEVGGANSDSDSSSEVSSANLSMSSESNVGLKTSSNEKVSDESGLGSLDDLNLEDLNLDSLPSSKSSSSIPEIESQTIQIEPELATSFKMTSLPSSEDIVSESELNELGETQIQEDSIPKTILSETKEDQDDEETSIQEDIIPETILTETKEPTQEDEEELPISETIQEKEEESPISEIKQEKEEDDEEISIQEDVIPETILTETKEESKIPTQEQEEELPISETIEELEEEPKDEISFEIEDDSSKSISKSSDKSISKSSNETPISFDIKSSTSIQQEEPIQNTVKNIIGMNLKYPNPFTTRLQTRMPQLFVKEKNEKFDAYTRMCPFTLSERRQPIILTKEEKNKMVQEHPDDIDEQADFIEYGTDPNDDSKKFYYTCPRYWCLKTDKFVTEKDILEGKCGPKVNKVEDAIIPRTAKEVPEGKYVYQFYDGKDRKFPGFHKEKTSSGLCIPCCYSNWSTTTMKKRRDICQGKSDDKDGPQPTIEEKEIQDHLRKEIAETEHYVKGPEKYGPQLGEHRWGFLPIVVQKFLHEVNEDCQITKTNMNLKLNHTCILRHGVEVSSTQSFVACIASAVFYAQRDENSKMPLINKFLPNVKYDVPSIKEMKQIIIKSLDLDRFARLQNGDLISSFANTEIEVNINNYKNTKLYKKIQSESLASGGANTVKYDIDKNNLYNNPTSTIATNTINTNTINTNTKSTNTFTNEDKDTTSIQNSEKFIISVAQAFENFKKYLEDNTIAIDYMYLWDLVCMPNPYIFEAGINLIILEIPEDDATNNIELVCPSNHYSSHAYDARKRSLIIIKRENYYEPIYGYRNDGKKILITKTFSEYDKNLPKALRAVFAKIIKPTIANKCKALISKPNEYRFKQAPLLDTLIETLLRKGYTIHTQVMNFQGKVIGLMVTSKNDLEGFVPCFPSGLTSLKRPKKICLREDELQDQEKESSEKCDYPFTYIDDALWKSYEETLEFLKHYYDYQEPEDIVTANCYDPKYFCRVVEDEIITGFLTNTNQFVPIKTPIPISNVNDIIKTITNNDMLVADINTINNSKIDTKRVEFIKKIQLETNFYNVFRNTIRILFNDYSNSKKRRELQNECNKKYLSYLNQLTKVKELLHNLVGEQIIFASKQDGYNYRDINEKEVYTCIKSDKEKCDKKGQICKYIDDKCSLVLPKENLVTDIDNEDFYYGKMADELLRYNRIKSFMFKPQSYLSFGQVKYNLRDNEIIILQELLTQEFFENLVPFELNKYAKYNNYDNAEPITTQKYEKNIEINNMINPYHERDCNPTEPTEILSGKWRKCFPSDYKNVDYNGSNYCTLYMLIDIIKEFKGIHLKIEDLKDQLIEEYSRITEDFTNKERVNHIINILREEAQFDANQLQDGSITFEQMVLQDGFIAINFDLWLLLVKNKIPSMFISNKPINETRFNSHEFVCYKNDDNNKDTNFAFILTPAMYRRKEYKLPEYKLIVDNTNNCKINIDNLNSDNCIHDIHRAIDHYISVEDYLDIVYEKDNTTTYKPKKKGLRSLEFELVTFEQEEENNQDNANKEEEIPENKQEYEEIFEFEPVERKKIKRYRPKKVKEEISFVIEDDEEDKPNLEQSTLEQPRIKKTSEEEIIEFEPVERKKKSRKKAPILVNPPGKKGTRKANKPKEDIEFVIEE
uniref:Uncharacterized protein n=1 Tax=viral metagenome TaxID=1070528 RepID=A0A6C0ISK9_9ZZZZ